MQFATRRSRVGADGPVGNSAAAAADASSDAAVLDQVLCSLAAMAARTPPASPSRARHSPTPAAQLHDDLAACERSLSAVQAERDALAAELRSEREARAALQSEHEGLRTQAGVLLQRWDEAQTQHAAVRAELEQTRAALEKALATLADVARVKGAWDDERAGVLQLRSQLEATITAAQQRLESESRKLAERVERAEAQAAEQVRQARAAHEGEMKALQAVLAERVRELELERTKREAMRAATERLQTDVTDLLRLFVSRGAGAGAAVLRAPPDWGLRQRASAQAHELRTLADSLGGAGAAATSMASAAAPRSSGGGGGPLLSALDQLSAAYESVMAASASSNIARASMGQADSATSVRSSVSESPTRFAVREVGRQAREGSSQAELAAALTAAQPPAQPEPVLERLAALEAELAHLRRTGGADDVGRTSDRVVRRVDVRTRSGRGETADSPTMALMRLLSPIAERAASEAVRGGGISAPEADDAGVADEEL